MRKGGMKLNLTERQKAKSLQLTSGVQPALSLTLGSAPFFSSSSTAAKSPYVGKK